MSKQKNSGKGKNQAAPAAMPTDATKSLDEVEPTGAMPNLHGGTPADAADTSAAGDEADDGEEADEGEGGKGKGSKSKNRIIDPTTGKPYDVLHSDDPVETAKRYGIAFLGANIPFTGGYKKFITTGHGYSNDTFPREMDTAAHVKVCVVSAMVLGDRAAKGDAEARTGLNVINKVSKVAVEEAEDNAKAQSLIMLAQTGMDVSALILQLPEDRREAVQKQIDANAAAKKGGKAKAGK